MPITPSAIPLELQACPQWVCWRLETRDGKPTKIPYQARNPEREAKSNDKHTWASFAQAVKTFEQAKRNGHALDGIGFVVTADDDFVGIDIDRCFNPDTGKIEPWAQAILSQFDSYSEITPSGTGFRIWLKGKLPPGGRRKGKLEMYDQGRYFTVTSQRLPDKPPEIKNCQIALNALHACTFPKPKKTPTPASKPAPALSLSDSELLDKAFAAKNGADFQALWRGDTARYDNDHSAADLALCSHLLFWTDGDGTRADQLFRQSGLMRADKWNKRHSADGQTYGQMTMTKAASTVTDFYEARQHQRSEPPQRDIPPLEAYADDPKLGGTPRVTTGGVDSQDTDYDRYQVPILDNLRATPEEAEKAQLHPRCIVEDYLYADVASLGAPGGTGKTTLILWEHVHIILGLPLYGLRITQPDPCLLITAEDTREICIARTREIMVAMNLTKAQREKVWENLLIWDVTGDGLRLTELDERGNITFTPMVDAVCSRFKEAGLSVITIDPTASFGAGERLVNDNEQALIMAGRRMVKGTGACIRYISHTGKANARDKTIDQYSLRGGSAMSDGCRMVSVLASVNGEDNDKLTPPSGFSLSGTNESGIVLARPKLSYAKPNLPLIWIKRKGYQFEHTTEPKLSKAELRRAYAEQLYTYLTDQLKQTLPRKHTKNTLEGTDIMPVRKLREAIDDLILDGSIKDEALPKEEQHGKRKTYLCPIPQR